VGHHIHAIDSVGALHAANAEARNCLLALRRLTGCFGLEPWLDGCVGSAPSNLDETVQGGRSGHKHLEIRRPTRDRHIEPDGLWLAGLVLEEEEEILRILSWKLRTVVSYSVD